MRLHRAARMRAVLSERFTRLSRRNGGGGGAPTLGLTPQSRRLVRRAADECNGVVLKQRPDGRYDVEQVLDE